MSKEELFEKLNAFLAERKEPVYSGDWPEVTPEEVQTLHELFDGIIQAKYGADYDGDYPIEYAITDRTRFMANTYQNVPYYTSKDSTAEQQDRADAALRSNILRALNALDNFIGYTRMMKR